MGKYFFRFFISVAVILLIFVVALFILSSLLISRDSVLAQRQNINYSALASANKKLQKELVYITKLEDKIKLSKNSNSIFEKMNTSGDSNLTREITFTSDELNALLAMSASGSQALKSNKNVFSVFFLGFANGVFDFNGSKKIPFMTPFGCYINISSKFTVDVKNSNLKLKVLSFKAGDIPFPKFIINYFMSKEHAAINKNLLIQELLFSVKEIKVFKDNVIVIYYPAKLLKVMSRLIYPV